MSHVAVYWMKAKSWSIVEKTSIVAGNAEPGEMAYVKPVNGSDTTEVRILQSGSEYVL